MNTAANAKIKNRKVAFILMLIALGMFGFGFAMVPLYSVLCKKLGFNGKTGGPSASGILVDESRTITVQFIANNNANLPWKFYPLVTTIHIHPGQNAKIAFFAQNDSNKTMVVQAIPSVTPGLAAKHLKKTECFCFTRQMLSSKQWIEMPVLFHLDTNLPKDINTVTLAYTLFDVTNKMKKIGNKTPGKI